MKTAELTGAALDWAVVKALGYGVDGDGCAVKDGIAKFNVDCFSPSEVWAQGGPIIEREFIETTVLACGHSRPTSDTWFATMVGGGGGDDTEAYGPTPLIAAMRCCVASKLGDEVELPEEV
jgi:hypothetical protein